MRVSWDRYAGEDVEAVVAMMVNREHPDSVRITPSKGDGGVDILDPAAAPDGGDVVYQVKRFATPLNAKQKREVAHSLARIFDPVKRDSRWASLNATAWRLVMPWDPTPEAYTWLKELAAVYAVPSVSWDGLTAVDGWCARYPEVVDYYLHGGRAEVSSASRQALAFASLQGSAAEGLTVRELAERVAESLHGPLTRDPHYRYEYRTGSGEPAPPARIPGLVMSTYESRRNFWFAIDVIALCAASIEERPITVNGEVSVRKGTKDAESLQAFFEYGTHPDADLSFTGSLDAPAGLGGRLTDAVMRVLRTPEDDAGKAELRLDILDGDGLLLASADVDRTHRGSGSKGVSFTLREINGVFTMSGRAALRGERSPTMSMQLERLPMTGQPAARVVGALEFLSHFHEPNQLRISTRHSPAHHGAVQSLTGVGITDQFTEVADAVAALCAMQEHTSTVLRVPDLAEHHSQVRGWLLAARVLSGSPLTRHYREGHALTIDLDADADVTALGSVHTVIPLIVDVGDDRVELGEIRVELDSPQVVSSSRLPDGRTRCTLSTPGRSMRWVWLGR